MEYAVTTGQDNYDEVLIRDPQDTAPVSFARRHIRAVAGLCLLVMAATVVAAVVLAAPHHDVPYQRTPSLAAHPIFSLLPKAKMTPGSEPGLTRCFMNWSHTTADNRTTLVHYDVEHVDQVSVPEQLLDLLGMNCTLPEQVTLVFSNSSAAKATAANLTIGTVLPLHDGWRCGEHIRKTVGKPVVTENAVTVATSNTTLEGVFKTAHIHIHTRYDNATASAAAAERISRQPNKNLTKASPRPDEPRERRTLLGWFDTALEAVDTLIDTAYEVYEVEEELSDGTIVLPETEATMFQYTHGPVPCTDSLPDDFTSCSFHADLKTIVKLDIEDWTLVSLEIALEGEAQATARIDVDMPRYSTQGSMVAMNEKLWSTVIMVGPVPIPLSFYGSLILSHSFALEAALKLKAGMQASAWLTMGMGYSIQEGFYNINGKSVSKTAGVDEFSFNGFNLDINFGVTPQLLVKAAYIGGPYVQVTMETDIDVDLLQESCSLASMAVTGTLDLGVGAKIDAHIGKHELLKREWGVSLAKTPAETLLAMCL
eukprot:m.500517 g.500517  ORF g.500517 m.500517 type:complete len:539 (-) comp60872_c0_seq1:298-1914(-)